MNKLLRIAAAGALVAGPAAYADSLFNASAEKQGSLVSEYVQRFELGDLVTVLVREQIEASTSADTNTKKESDVESDAAAGANRFLVGEDEEGRIIDPGNLPNWEIEAENETRNTGSTVRSSELTTTITCFVTEIMPNGNIKVEGEKEVSVNREDTTLLVSGIVRPRDISPNNTVPSTAIANAKVLLKGKGPLWNNQRRGLVTRFLDWFSPF